MRRLIRQLDENCFFYWGMCIGGSVLAWEISFPTVAAMYALSMGYSRFRNRNIPSENIPSVMFINGCQVALGGMTILIPGRVNQYVLAKYKHSEAEDKVVLKRFGK